MPGWDAPVHTDAKPQHATIDPGLKKYHTWTNTGSRHFSTSTHSLVQETAEKDVAAMQLDQVSLHSACRSLCRNSFLSLSIFFPSKAT
jgi:hypothetical protein